jgi:hypothetical protein
MVSMPSILREWKKSIEIQFKMMQKLRKKRMTKTNPSMVTELISKECFLQLMTLEYGKCVLKEGLKDRQL